MRVNIILALGATGEQKDLEEFMELMRADFDFRASEVAREIMGGRVTILPMSETVEDTSEPQ